MLALAEMETLKRRLSQVVCPACTESKPDGSCGLEEPDQCPMWVQLPRLVKVVKAVQSPRMDPYLRKVREDVCANCRALQDGRCDARDEGRCALDAYLLVIVQTIEGFLAGRAGAAERSETNWLNQPLFALITHIVNKHHAFVKEQAPRLEELIAKVYSLHAESHPELLRIQKWFFVLKEELTHHVQKEEGVLFPYIIHLEEAAWRGEPAPWAPFETVKTPIEMMSLEHDRSNRALHGIRAASFDYRLPEDGSVSYSLMLGDLQSFERDLLNHIHLENDILFPRAVALEQAATEAPDRAY